MVEYSIIKEIIEKSIILKCGKKPSYSLNSLSNQIKHTMNVFAENTRKLDYETGIIINDKGNIVKQSNHEDESETSVYIGESEYFEDKLRNEWCKDIIDEYNTKMNIARIKGDSIPDLMNEYQKKIEERLSLLSSDVNIHIDHNHPCMYDEGNNLYYNISTCLSPDDIKSLVSPVVAFDFTLHNLIKSVTCEGSNGSRMTIINHRTTPLNVYDKKFNDAINKLVSSWSKYSIDLEYKYKRKVYDMMNEGSFKNKNLAKYINQLLKEESKNIFPEYLKESMDDFEKLGFELKWE